MSSDSEIGAEVEKEFEEKAQEQKKSRAFSNRLTTAEKFRLLEQWKQGKVDKYYNVYPDKKREGEFRFIKRRKPLDMPDDNQVMSVKTSEAPEKVEPPPAPPSTQQVLQEPKQQFPTEFFQFQSNVNTSLQRELESLQEKYTKLSDKLDKQRKENPKKVVSKPRSKVKEEPKKKDEEYEYEYEYEYVDEEEPAKQEPPAPPPPPQPQPEPEPQYYIPYIRRRGIDIRDF